MAVFRPFAALRPVSQLAEQTAALPYDVMDEAEAREMAKGRPYSFLHIDRAEIDFKSGINPYSSQVYERAAQNLREMEARGIYRQDGISSYYIYQEERNGRTQTGFVGCASVDDYLSGVIKKHELTRREKEEDRVAHVTACQAHTGPIFLTCPYPAKLKELMEKCLTEQEPVYDFLTPEGVGQRVWVVEDRKTCQRIQSWMEEIPAFYIADGHHRAASAVRVGENLRKAAGGYTGEEAFNYFLSVLFPCDELEILGYHRVVKDLNGFTPRQMLAMLGVNFEILLMEGFRCRPMERRCFGMYLEGEWYHLRAREGSFQEEDPVARLDVSILQENVLSPLLGIGDPRTDERISFVGGARKLSEIEAQVDRTGGVAFILYPTGIEELMEIADAGKIMPPKSTWFEPKIYSGLLIHKF